ncbi:MAG TPA: hypothetical protein VGD81_00230 [Opitutaceae bacterium]
MKNRGDLKLWAFVAGGFALLALAWTAMFMAASKTPVQTVPLVTTGSR